MSGVQQAVFQNQRSFGPPPDAQFNYVTMLLHGDGTNGAQNNTFIDSSTNAFSITRNGNTTQGSFSPYGSNWSNFFGTAQHKLSTTGMTALGSDFTLELWIFPTSFNDYNTIFDNRLADGDPAGLVLGLTSAAKVYFYTNLAFQITTTTAISLNTWTHIALVRSGSGSGNVKIYINGVADATTATYTTSFTSTAPSIGDDWGTRGFLQYFGYLSNLRAVTSALYTGTFTPSTTPLTAISGTVLLTCQSNRFIDNSSSALTMTVTGTPSVQRFNPFGASTAYDTSVIGGSGYFDGSGDYLGCGSQSAYAFGTGDFTLNAWFYLTSAPTYMSIADTRASGWALAIDASRAIYLYSDAVGFIVSSAVGAVPLNAWTYVTVKRVSGTITLYLNAVSIATASNSTNFSNTTLTIGANGSGGEPFFGYICDFQAIKGTGTTPTLPTAPLTNVTNTSLLLNYTNGAIFDNAMMNNLETVGNAQISTSVKKYGTGSMYFDGGPAYLVTPASPNLTFGTGDFTVEFWINVPSFANFRQHVSTRPSDNANYWSIDSKGDSKFYFYTDTFVVTSAAQSTNTWIHIAAVRSSGTFNLYIDGVSQGSASLTNNFLAYPLSIGATASGNQSMTGYIDDLRITKGYARYTATFTPPTSALSDTGPY